MGPKAQKEPLIVEGLDINDVQLPRLLRHVSKMLEDLVLERGERTRAQMECDLVRTAWQNTEKELDEAKMKRMKLHMEGESLGAPYVEALKKVEEELQFVKYEVTLNVKDKEEKCDAKVQQFEQKIIEEDIPKMLEKKRAIQLEMYEKKNKLMEEVAVAGKEVVETIDKQFAFSEELLLKRICNMLKNVSIRSKYLNIFYKLQIMKLQEEKNKLISELEENNNVNFLRIRDFFKSIIQNDIVLIFSLQDKLKGMQNLRNKRLQYVQEVKERLTPLRSLMQEAYKELQHGYRIAKMYDHDLEEYNKYCKLLNEREKQIHHLQNTKSEMTEDLANGTAENKCYLDMIDFKKNQAQALIKQIMGDPDIFKCYSEYFRQLAEYIEEENNLEKLKPGFLQELRERLENEHQVVKHIHIAVTKEIKYTNDLVEEANKTFRELGIQDKALFVKSMHKKFPFQEGPSGLANMS